MTKYPLLLFFLLVTLLGNAQTLTITGAMRQTNDLHTHQLVRVSRVPMWVIITPRFVIFSDSAHTDTVRITSITQRRRSVFVYALETPANFILDVPHHLLQYNDTLTRRKVTFLHVKIATKY